jgi:hypothetical protein
MVFCSTDEATCGSWRKKTVRKITIRLVAAILVLLLSLVALSTLITSIQVVDRDGDDLQDVVEKRITTNPLNPDSDDDQFPDGAEYTYWTARSAKEHKQMLAPTGDVDGDGAPNILDYDSDNDGLSDGREIELGTDPANPDTDNDGLHDGDEVNRGTDPLNPDSNGDGILDGDTRGGQNGDDFRYAANQPDTRTLFRNGQSGSPTCFAIFNPSLQDGDRLKRGFVCDAITADYIAYVASPQRVALELSDVEYELRFQGEIPLYVASNQPIAIPSVSPTANIISYTSSSPDVPFDFFKDGADNYYVVASRLAHGQNIQLTIMTTANASYFQPYNPLIPETLTINEIPETMKHTPPPSVCEKARLIIGDLGLTGETNVKKIIHTMVEYFSNFTKGDIPTPEQEPDTYIAIARAKHGACYPRSYAFFITANAIGIPTRLITNDCHAFVEVYIPPYGWEMIDLGGLGVPSICNPEGFDVLNLIRPPSEEGDRITIITLTSVSHSADKNGAFIVEGTVTDSQLTGLQNIDVTVTLNHTKKEQGKLVGQGLTEGNGEFRILCTVPADVQLGENQVVAHARGNAIYLDSWTDPTIEIYTNTTIVFTMGNSIGLGEDLPIKGTLSDVGNIPVGGAVVKASWNESFIGQTTTDEQGVFNLTYTPLSSLGRYHVSVVYDGDQYRRGSQAEQTIYIKDKGTRLQMNVTPTTVERNHTIFIQGTFTSSTHEAMGFVALNVLANGIVVGNVSTKADGAFETSWIIPPTSPLGNRTIAVRFPGTEIYADASDEHTVLVQSKTSLEILLPVTTNIKQNTIFAIAGKLTDDQSQPVGNVRVEITGKTISRNATTDGNGQFNASISIPASFPSGKTTFVIASKGTLVYEPSQTQKDFNIIEVGPSYLSVIIACAAAVGIIIGVLLFMKVRKRKKHFEIQTSLQEIITEALSRLQTEADHRKTVLDCYKKMCELLMQKGIIKEAFQTPREFAMVAKIYLRVPPENLYDFTKVFEKARYSSREINEKDREKAIRCLRRIVFAQVHGRRTKKTQGMIG